MSKRNNVWTYRTKKNKKKKLSKNSVKEVKILGQYFVERILDHAIDRNGDLMYFLKWEDYPEDENSWELENQLVDCPDVLKMFKWTVNGKHPPKYSWEEFDKFCQYLKKVIDPSFADTAVLHRLSNKSVAILDLKNENTKEVNSMVSQIKEKIESKSSEILNKIFDARNRNTERQQAVKMASDVAKSLKINENFGSIREFIEFVDRRAEINDKLKKWSKKVNKIISKNGEGVPISVTNDVDLEVPVLQEYICENVYLDKQKLRTKSTAEEFIVHSCQCVDCYAEREECCTSVIGYPMAYNRKGLLSNSMNSNIIFECNKRCKCGPNCNNRVVQRGRQYKIELFRTEDASNRGWGVRALEAIPKGAFVSSYIGEIVSLLEANKRITTYLFDLGANCDRKETQSDEYKYVIDADKYGNICRYVNHSCEPNCRMIFVWINSYDKLMPKVCLFTTRPIRANEELTYHYGMQISETNDINHYHSGQGDAQEDSLHNQHLKINEQDVEQDVERDIDEVSTDSGLSSLKDNQTSKTPDTESPAEPKANKVMFKQIECRCGSKQCQKYLYS